VYLHTSRHGLLVPFRPCQNLPCPNKNTHKQVSANNRLKSSQLWNIILPWNRVLTSSMSIFQTSREHVIVALTVSTFCAWHVLSSDRSDRLASPSKNKNIRNIFIAIPRKDVGRHVTPSARREAETGFATTTVL
jgi:hypothetical protein